MTKLFLAAGVAALAIAAPVSAKPEKGGGGERKAHVAKADKGGGQAKAFKAKGADRQVKAREFKAAKAPNREFKAAKRVEFKQAGKSKADRAFAKFDRKDRDVVRVRDFDDDWDRGHWAGSCPPGLSKHPGLCMPHGQAKKLVGGVLPAAYRNSMLPLGLRNIY